MARRSPVRYGVVGQVRSGEAKRGKARFGRQGMVRRD